MIVSLSRYPVPLISKVKLRDAALCIYGNANSLSQILSFVVFPERLFYGGFIYVFIFTPAIHAVSTCRSYCISRRVVFFLIISFEFLILPTCVKRKPVPVFWIACFDRPGVYKKKKVQKCSKAASLHGRKRYMLSVVSTKFEGAELIFFLWM